MSNEAEELLIALRKETWTGPLDRYSATLWPAIKYADKLIAAREPKIMSAHDMLRVVLDANTKLEGAIEARNTLLADTAAVLNEALSNRQTATPILSTPERDGIEEARRIVADTLKAVS